MHNVSVKLNADNQIEVRVGTESRVGESYYLGLQPQNEQHEFRPAEGILALLSEWIRLLSEMLDGQQLFLPFDFSDEFTRWITVLRSGREVTILFGWATVEGWAICPGDLSEYAQGLPGFVPDEPIHTQSFYLPKFMSDLRRSFGELSGQPQRKGPHSSQNDPRMK